MVSMSRLADKLSGKDFIITAEYLPVAGTDALSIESSARAFGENVVAVNVADNHYGVALSSLAASVALSRLGIEPVFQIVTRDRNRIALQSDLLGAYLLGVRNVLCLSGFHQTTIGCGESANVFDIDSVQLIDMVKKMNEGLLLDGTKIQGAFSMLIGAVANPYMKPLELNMLRLKKKVAAGASFIQTQAVFDTDMFEQWFDMARREGITEQAAILAGVLPLKGAQQARELRDVHTDFNIPEAVIDRLSSADDQQKQGVKIAAETIKKLKGLSGLRGVHILSGGNEAVVPDLIAAASA